MDIFFHAFYNYFDKTLKSAGVNPENLKRRGWPTKKILGVIWSKKAEIMLATISFSRITSISISKFCPFLHVTKAS